MAATRFSYVKSYELLDAILPNTYMVVRLDGRGFHRFSDVHRFEKPNDLKALELMDKSARTVMEEYPDISMAFGESDEYSFLIRKGCALYNRRQSKILTSMTSLFTSSYVYNWPQFFPSKPLQYPPIFDGRLVVYPGSQEIKDYFAWRQADTHINNLYNTTFWALVQQGGTTTTVAHERLKGTVSSQKNEILFSQFGINYNTLSPRFRKGSILVREPLTRTSLSNVVEGVKERDLASSDLNPSAGLPVENTQEALDSVATVPPISAKVTESSVEERIARKKKQKELKKAASNRKDWKIRVLHCDVIEQGFWDERTELLD